MKKRAIKESSAYDKLCRLCDKDSNMKHPFDRRGRRPIYTFSLTNGDDEIFETWFTDQSFNNLELAKRAALEYLKSESDLEPDTYKVEIYEEEETKSGDIHGEPELVWCSDWETDEKNHRRVDEEIDFETLKENELLRHKLTMIETKVLDVLEDTGKRRDDRYYDYDELVDVFKEIEKIIEEDD